MCCMYLYRSCLCVGYNERTALFRSLNTHLALIKEHSYWPWPVAPVILLLQKQWLYSRHGLLLGALTRTQTCTLALLLMLMPRSVLLSSCKQRFGQAAALHLNTTIEPELKPLIWTPEWKKNDTQRTSLPANKPLQRPLYSSLFSPLCPRSKSVSFIKNSSEPVFMIPAVPPGTRQPL